LLLLLLYLQEAHESGIALVVACAQDQAENYVEGLRLNGLISTMEPGA
jgi:ATP-dependent Clp protease adaptor protein ClpS